MLLWPFWAEAQSAYRPTHQMLNEYQGVYEYQNHTTLQIAASPEDTVLYALIGEARYALKAVSKDVFVNGGGDKATFIRTPEGVVKGFEERGSSFARISQQTTFPDDMWFPRTLKGQPVLKAALQHPANLHDGLATGPIKGTGLDSSRLDSMLQNIVKGQHPGIHSVLIMKDNKLVLEEYFYGHTADTVHPLRSATKSFVSALTGLAIQEGKIKDINQKVLSFFPEYTFAHNTPDKQRITLEDLLTNQSGLACDLSDPNSPGNESVMGTTDDWIKFTLDLPMACPPGTKGMYCSGNPIVLGRILEKATGKSLPDYAQGTLFKALGITSYKWRFKPDASSEQTFCQLYMRPRDMAKFGQLYLDKGKWQGQQVLTPQWIATSTAEHTTIKGVSYGYLWWRKYFNAGGVRYDGIGAQGNGGQRIYYWPNLNMVVVVTGGAYNQQSWSDIIIARYILASFNPK